jgi:hypothetical protein
VREELHKLKQFLLIYKDEYKNNNIKKIDNFFEYINKLIKYNYKIAMKVLHQCNKEQENQLDQKIKEIEDLNEELNLIDFNLEDINKENNFELLNHEEIINSINDRVNSFLNYEYELNLMQMDLKIKENVKENLFELIQNSYEIDVDYLMIPEEKNDRNSINNSNIKNNNRTLTIKNLLQKDKLWICVCSFSENICGLNNEIIKCNNCGRYRKIQTLDYFSNNPTDSFEDLKQILSLRRKDESKEFKRLLSEAQILNNNKKQIRKSVNFQKEIEKDKDRLYIIEINWFLNWKCYVMNDATEKTLSNNKKMLDYVKNLGKIYIIFILIFLFNLFY